MSIEQSPDAYQIEQTKQQIRALVAEIAQLSKTDVAPEEFYGQFLPRVVSALAAVGGAVWTVNSEGHLALQYQVNLQETRLRDNEEHLSQHSRLLYRALSQSEEGMLVPPHSGPGDAVGASAEEMPVANPTEFLLVFGLLKTDLERVGLVEIFQRQNTELATQKGYLRFLTQMCELAGDFLKSHQLRHFSHRQTLWTQLEDFTRNVHASLDPRETAYTIANEGRRLIECDRVSVAIRVGKKCRIEAISGQDMFDKRSNTVRLLGRLATAVVATGEPVWYTGDTHDLPPQVEEAVQEYVDEAHSKAIAVLPLGRPAPPEEDDSSNRVEREEPIGALIVERIEDNRVSASLMQRADVVCRHSSAAMANAMEHQNLFLMPVWRALGKARWVVEARTLPKTLSVAGVVLLLILFFVLWQAKFMLEAKGTLEPVRRQNVFAGIDGVVEELSVDHGAKVAKHQLLAKLRNPDLETSLTDVQGQLLVAREQLSDVQRLLVNVGRATLEERAKLAGQQAEFKEKIRSLEAQIALYRVKQADLIVKSPIDGEVVTWDLRLLLFQRPVQRGQMLLRVVDPEGPWQLELQMPENQMGHVVKAQLESVVRMRAKLRDLLAEDMKSGKPPEAGGGENGELEKAAEQAAAEIPAEEVYKKILDVYLRRLRARIEPIRDGAADKKIREMLGRISREPTYGEAIARLDAVVRELQGVDAAQNAQESPKSDDSLKSQAAQDVLAQLQSMPRDVVTDDRLEVSYILATEPGKSHWGRIAEIHRNAEVRGDEGNTVLIKVEINKSELPPLQPGAAVTAKVDCGHRALGYVLLHDVIAFVQSRILFRYF